MSEEKRLIFTETEPVIAHFSDALKSINIPDVVDISLDSRVYWNVKYDERVTEEEKIPYLDVLVCDELGHISSYLEGLEWEDVWLGDILEDSKIVLSPEKIMREYLNPNKEDAVISLIDRYEAYGVFAVPTKEVRRAVCGDSFEDLIKGKYDPDTHTIYIYYRTLNSDETEDYIADLIRVLAHEVFHLYHHFFTPNLFFNQSKKAIRVKESLADFFSFTYCIINETFSDYGFGRSILRNAKVRYKSWKRELDLIWPYSYALYYMRGVEGEEMPFSERMYDYEVFGCLDKMRKVFQASRDSMEKAYDVLVDAKHKKVKLRLEDLRHQMIEQTPYSTQFLTIPEKEAERMSEEEKRKAFDENNINKYESLALIDILEEIREKRGAGISSKQMLEKLTGFPMEYHIDIRTVRRLMNTLAYYRDDIWRISDGHEYYYIYSENQPEGQATEVDLTE